MIVQPQRYEGDCVTMALTMFFNLAYEDVAIAMSQVIGEKRRRGRQGAYISETIRVAEALGKTLKRKRKFTLTTEGVLIVRTKRSAHAIVLRRGLIFDPADASVWDPEVYFANKSWWKPTTLLIEGP